MANFSAKIFSSSLSSLRSQLAKISVVSNNIANAETPGYSRRVVNLAAQPSLEGGFLTQVGSGVEIQSISRNFNSFLFQNVLVQSSEHGLYAGQNSLIKSLDNLFSINGVGNSVSKSLNDFFQAAQEIALNPSSVSLRRAFIEKATQLTDSIRLTFNALARLQNQAQKELEAKIDRVNEITGEIAKLNEQIKSFEAQNGLGSALDLRDQRDKLTEELAKYVNFDFVENPDSTLSMFLKNGLSLVNGGSNLRLLAVVNPSFTANTTFGLDGSGLKYVVLELGPNSHVDVSEVLLSSGGEIGGLLQFRGLAGPSITNPFSVDGTVVKVARQIEALSRFLLTTVNRAYLGWDPNLPNNGDEDPGTPLVFDPSSVDLNGNTPNVYGLFGLTDVTIADSNSDGLPNDLGSLSVFTTANRLRFLVNDPLELAFSRDLDPSPGSIQGSPGDGRIAELIARLKDQQSTFSAPGFSYTGKPGDLTQFTQTYVGSIVRENNEGLTSSANRLEFYSKNLESVRGVNSDEELAMLIQYQRNYQYSARLLSVADNLLAEILQIL